MEANTEIRHATADLVAYQVQELGAQQLQGVGAAPPRVPLSPPHGGPRR